MFIGSNYDRTTIGSNLPKLVSSIASIQTGWSHNANGSISGTYNAAYDVWFSTGASGDYGAPSGGYLMVWLYDPSSAQPVGSIAVSGISLAGGNWTVWTGTFNSRPVISYVRQQTSTSMSFDLNLFVKDAVSRGIVQNNWYLTNVFAGFEIWSGGVGLKTNNFCAIVN